MICVCIFVVKSVGNLFIETYILNLTLPSPKGRGFSGYAQPIGSRYRLTGLPDPKEF